VSILRILICKIFNHNFYKYTPRVDCKQYISTVDLWVGFPLRAKIGHCSRCKQSIKLEPLGLED